MEHVYLVGAEAVQSAGSNMRAAAEEMRRAAEVITTALQQHREWADTWLAAFGADRDE